MGPGRAEVSPDMSLGSRICCTQFSEIAAAMVIFLMASAIFGMVIHFLLRKTTVVFLFALSLISNSDLHVCDQHYLTSEYQDSRETGVPEIIKLFFLDPLRQLNCAGYLEGICVEAANHIRDGTVRSFAGLG